MNLQLLEVSDVGESREIILPQVSLESLHGDRSQFTVFIFVISSILNVFLLQVSHFLVDGPYVAYISNVLRSIELILRNVLV